MSTRDRRRAPGARRAPPAAQTPAPSGSEPEPGPAERIAYSVDEAARLTGLSRDLLYDEMRRGNLTYLKIGRRRLITRQHLEQFLHLAPEPAIRQAGRAGADI
jgi:excisionase family DNA binding protein